MCAGGGESNSFRETPRISAREGDAIGEQVQIETPRMENDPLNLGDVGVALALYYRYIQEDGGICRP